ncbi:MAG: hypothetical protein DRG20_07230, partial [Deltaproteobacteria bacterium]
EVDPIFNGPQGLGLYLLKDKSPLKNYKGIKQGLKKVFNTIGIFKETIEFFPFYLLGYLLCDRRHYDIFIGGGQWALLLGYVLKKMRKVKIVVADDYDYQAGNQTITKFRFLFTRYLENFVLKQSDLIISVGHLLAELRKKELKREIKIIPNGVDYNLFAVAQEKLPHPPTLIYTGAVEWWSGLDLVIKAMAEVKKDIPNLQLMIIGHCYPQYLNYLFELAKQLRIKKNIEYLGRKPYKELPFYLKRADIGLAVYSPIKIRKYGFSLKTIEYMAAGLPVIITQNIQTALIVKKYQCGKLVEFEENSIATAIKHLFINQSIYKTYSSNCLKYAPQFDWEKLIDDFYQTIISVNSTLLS